MAAYFCCDEFEKSYMHDKLVFLKKDIYKVGKPKIRCHSCANICLLLGSFEILHSLHELASDMHMLHIYCMST